MAIGKHLLDKLQSAGYTHIFWNQPEYERLGKGFRPNNFTAESLDLTDAFKEDCLTQLYSSNGLYVYAINYEVKK